VNCKVHRRFHVQLALLTRICPKEPWRIVKIVLKAIIAIKLDRVL